MTKKVRVLLFRPDRSLEILAAPLQHDLIQVEDVGGFLARPEAFLVESSGQSRRHVLTVRANDGTPLDPALGRERAYQADLATKAELRRAANSAHRESSAISTEAMSGSHRTAGMLGYAIIGAVILDAILYLGPWAIIIMRTTEGTIE